MTEKVTFEWLVEGDKEGLRECHARAPGGRVRAARTGNPDCCFLVGKPGTTHIGVSCFQITAALQRKGRSGWWGGRWQVCSRADGGAARAGAGLRWWREAGRGRRAVHAAQWMDGTWCVCACVRARTCGGQRVSRVILGMVVLFAEASEEVGRRLPCNVTCSARGSVAGCSWALGSEGHGRGLGCVPRPGRAWFLPSVHLAMPSGWQPRDSGCMAGDQAGFQGEINCLGAGDCVCETTRGVPAHG